MPPSSRQRKPTPGGAVSHAELLPLLGVDDAVRIGKSGYVYIGRRAAGLQRHGILVAKHVGPDIGDDDLVAAVLQLFLNIEHCVYIF